MKDLNAQSKPSLLEKVAVSVGNKLAGIPIEPFACLVFTLHEPEMPDELIVEMANRKDI